MGIEILILGKYSEGFQDNEYLATIKDCMEPIFELFFTDSLWIQWNHLYGSFDAPNIQSG